MRGTSILIRIAFLVLAVGGIVFLYGSFSRPPFVDEYSFQINVLQFLGQKTWIPSYANYPTFFSYVLFIPTAVVFCAWYFLSGLPWSGFFDPYLIKLIFDAHFELWLGISRLVTLVFAAALVFLLYRDVRGTVGRTAAVLGMTLLVLDPYGEFLARAQYALPDVPVACLMFVMMLLCRRFLITLSRRDLFAAAAVAGLAASMKLNAAPGIFPLLVAPWLVLRAGRAKAVDILGVVVFWAGAFFLGSPFYLLAPSVAHKGVMLETLVLSGFGQGLSDGNHYIWLARELWQRSPLFTILMAAAVLRSFQRRRREDLLMHALLVPSIVIIGGLDKKEMAYLLFLFPFMVTQVTEFIVETWSVLKVPRQRWMMAGVLAFLIVSLSFPAVSRLYANILEDNRTTAGKWISQNIPGGSRLLLDWAYGPLPREEWRMFFSDWQKPRPEHEVWYRWALEQETRRYKVAWLAHDYELISPQSREAEFLITSSYCYRPYLLESEPSSDESGLFTPTRLFYHRLFSGQTNFRLWKRFDASTGPVVDIFRRK